MHKMQAMPYKIHGIGSQVAGGLYKRMWSHCWVPAILLRRWGGGVTASRPVGMESTASGSDLRPSDASASPRGLFSGLGGRARFLLR